MADFSPGRGQPFVYGADPDQQVLLADSVGLALQVVLDTLAPAELLLLLEDQQLGAGEGVAKLDQQARVGAEETKDALKRIANDRQVLVWRGSCWSSDASRQQQSWYSSTRIQR